VTWQEAVIALVLVLLVGNAARRGFVREGSLLVGLAGGLWLAGRLYHQFGGPLAHDGGAPWSVLVYFGLVFGVVIAAAALSALAVPLVRQGPLRLLDRLAGLLIGLGEAGLVVGLFATVAERLGALRFPMPGLPMRAVDLARTALAWLSTAIPPDILALARPG